MNNFKQTIDEAVAQGGRIEFGGSVIDRSGFFVEPTIISNLPHNADVVKKETFAPIVYVLKAKSLDEAIQWNNEVDQGLSSALFTKNISSVFQVSHHSSDLMDANIDCVCFVVVVDWAKWIGLRFS